MCQFYAKLPSRPPYFDPLFLVEMRLQKRVDLVVDPWSNFTVWERGPDGLFSISVLQQLQLYKLPMKVIRNKNEESERLVRFYLSLLSVSKVITLDTAFGIYPGLPVIPLDKGKNGFLPGFGSLLRLIHSRGVATRPLALWVPRTCYADQKHNERFNMRIFICARKLSHQNDLLVTRPFYRYFCLADWVRLLRVGLSVGLQSSVFPTGNLTIEPQLADDYYCYCWHFFSSVSFILSQAHQVGLEASVGTVD
ncbi:hypothetical protein M569_00386 [Genlisea aurea]|uniref:Uncharacterized protein n=1 Tax=Genlisea aurea TaxID=192259 RepID=S8D3T5_9LAMI|nr:hypothetical protein M569_00386 [Genlisea aurea]